VSGQHPLSFSYPLMAEDGTKPLHHRIKLRFLILCQEKDEACGGNFQIACNRPYKNALWVIIIVAFPTYIFYSGLLGFETWSHCVARLDSNLPSSSLSLLSAVIIDEHHFTQPDSYF
jgi:hypothetical protein